MSIRVAIVDGPIAAGSVRVDGCAGEERGAVLRFEGIVRRTEDGRALAALYYEAYEPMASRELARLAASVADRHGLHGFAVVHSRGEVPVGGCSLVVETASAHRGEALAAMAEFIDLLKRDVPIWKRPIWETGP